MKSTTELWLYLILLLVIILVPIGKYILRKKRKQVKKTCENCELNKVCVRSQFEDRSREIEEQD